MTRRSSAGRTSRRAAAGDAAGCRRPGRGVADHRVPGGERPCCARRSRKVGKALADRVNKAVAELGYTANLQARAVATGQSTMVGVALRDISDPYFSEIAAGLIEVADGELIGGGRLLLCMTSTAANEDAEREYVALMRAQRARAVVLVGSRSDNTAGQGRAARRARGVHQGGRPRRLHRAGPARRGHGAAGEPGRRRGPGQGPRGARAPAVRGARRAALAADRAGQDRTASGTGSAPGRCRSRRPGWCTATCRATAATRR